MEISMLEANLFSGPFLLKIQLKKFFSSVKWPLSAMNSGFDMTGMNWRRAFAVWLLIAVVESIHGALRQLFLVPAIGDLPSRQLGVFVGSALILLIAGLTARWLGAVTLRAQFAVGTLWVVLIVIFEFGLGAVLGYRCERMLADYQPSQGGFMGLGLMVLFLAPALGTRFQR